MLDAGKSRHRQRNSLHPSLGSRMTQRLRRNLLKNIFSHACDCQVAVLDLDKRWSNFRTCYRFRLKSMLPNDTIFRCEGNLIKKRCRTEAYSVAIRACITAPLTKQVGVLTKARNIYTFSLDRHINITPVKILNGTSNDRSPGIF